MTLRLTPRIPIVQVLRLLYQADAKTSQRMGTFEAALRISCRLALGLSTLE